MSRINDAKEILEYWYITEFLQPNNFPGIEVTRKVDKAKENTQYHTYCFELREDADINKYLRFTLKDELKVWDAEIQICVGRFRIKPIIEQIFEKAGESIPQKIQFDNMCLFSLRVDTVGNYVEGTLQVSPFAWCSNMIISQEFLNYNSIGPTGNLEYCKKFEDELMDIRVPLKDKLDSLYEEISGSLLGFLPFEEKIKSKYAVAIFNKYKDESSKSYYQGDYSYSNLQKSYFLKDLDFVKSKLSENSKVLNYILALNESQAPKVNMLLNRKEIKEWYAPDKMPLGQWPSKYNLSFMQQLAVNIGKQESKEVGEIFSVNGPPGTGKTTLLKEIVVDNIISRALELTKFSHSDEAFSEQKLTVVYDNFTKVYYKPDKSLIKYGMLVLSSSNNAVENITMELPDAFQMIKEKTYTGLFDIDCSPYSVLWEINEDKKKEIYFSYPSAIASGGKHWGFISARLGKRKNINEFCKALSKVLFHSWKDETEDSGKISFNKAKNEYLRQRECVLNMQKPIAASIEEEIKAAKDKIKLDDFMELSNEKINVKEALKDDCINDKINKEALYKNINIQIEIYKNEEENLKNKIDELINQICDLEDRRNFVERIFPEPQNRVTKYIAKLFHTERVEVLKSKKNEKAQYENSRNEIQISLKADLEDIKKLEIEINACDQRLEYIEKDILKLRNELESEILRFREVDQNFKINRKMLEEKGIKFLTETYLEGLRTNNTTQYEAVHCESFFVCEEYNVEREKLFYQALMLHKAFYLDSTRFQNNIRLLLKYWGNIKNSEGQIYDFNIVDRQNFAAELFNSLFLLVPVISSTFASVQTLLRDVVEENSLGMMIVDEAGQAMPQVAVGALWRCQRAVIVGDPKQIEPIVMVPDCIYRKLFNDDIIKNNYINKTLSVQNFADRINKYSGKIVSDYCGEELEEWVGCPLVVHRRCIEPMFSISNQLSYGGIMVNKTQPPNDDERFIYPASCWVQCEGKEEGRSRGAANHYVKNQGRIAYFMIMTGIEKNEGEFPDLFVISPFRSVIESLKKELSRYKEFKSDTAKKWLDSHCGTVHTFQGKEAGEVIYMLGCDNGEEAKGATRWVNESNVNVAITRAKHRVYILGDRAAWESNRVVDFARVRLANVDNEKVVVM